MKLFHLHAKSKIDLKFIEKCKLKGKIGLVTTIQYLDEIKKIKNKNFIFGGQVLGCNAKSAMKIENKVDKYLFVGTGKFHPIEISLKTNKEVYIANPYDKTIKRLDKKEVDSLIKLKKIAYKKYLMADNVGILVSTKVGQNKLKEAIKLKKKLNKKSFIFITDEIRENEFENFPEIQAWINTACPRIEGKNIINLEDLEKFENGR